MAQMRKSGVEWLRSTLDDLTRRADLARYGNINSADTLASRTAAAPAKRTAANSIRALLAGGTITNSVVIAELTNDASKLDSEAAQYDEFVERATLTLKGSQDWLRAIDAVIAAVTPIAKGPAGLSSFTFTSKALGRIALTATTSSDTRGDILTFWRVPRGVQLDTDRTPMKTFSTAPSTTYSFVDDTVPQTVSSWDYYLIPADQLGVPGPTSGPVTVEAKVPT